MAKAGVVCRDCGTEISRQDKFCRNCGARVDRSKNAPVNRPPAPSSETTRPRTCEVCGHPNTHTGEYCESCGVRLSELAPAQGTGPVERNSRRGIGQELAKQRRKIRFEPWQIMAGVGLTGLLAVFIYLEANREWPTQKPQVPDNRSGASAAILHEIEHLQEAVDANPDDQASVLRLANLLHDGAAENPALFSRAVAAYKKYLALKPDDPDARVDLGICYYELARFDTSNAMWLLGMAVSEMEGTIKNHPRHQAAAFNLGIVNLYSGKLNESNSWFRKAIELDPNSAMGKRASQILEQHSFSPPS